MATTAIADEIEALTGVGTADSSFLVSAQKFVVSSVPKTLLKWASSLTDPSSNGGNASQGTSVVVPIGTDKILSVSRNGFSAEEVPYNMKGFIANSASLHLSTNTYPKYYFDNAVTDKGVVVVVKPAPTDSETVRVLYVDHTKIDDDSDLRNAVIYRACSSEFGKLSSSLDSDINTALTAINTELDETQAICDLINSKVDSSVVQLDEADTLIDANIDTATAAIVTATARINTAVILANSEFDLAVISANASNEDIELASAHINVGKGFLEEANAAVGETQAYVAEVGARVNQVNSQVGVSQGYIAAAQGYASELQSKIAIATGYSNEVNTRLSKQQFYSTESSKYYNWASKELETYIGTNEKTIQYQSQQQTQAQ